MALLHDIQAAAMSETADTSSLLLRVKFLAAKLGSQPLADWVQHESEGYPNEATVPSYRELGVTYKATFSGPFGSGIKNAPIPSHLIAKLAGDQWNTFEARQSMAAIESLIAASDGTLQIDASNLILLLQGKIYENMACNAVHGTIGTSGLVAIRHAVRSRLLDLTLQLEKDVPVAALVEVGGHQATTAKDAALTTQFFQQIVQGDVNNISSSGQGNIVTVGEVRGDIRSLIKHLGAQGLAQEEAEEAAAIIASEPPETESDPLGEGAKEWVWEKAKQAGSSVATMGKSVATALLVAAAKHYWGL